MRPSEYSSEESSPQGDIKRPAWTRWTTRWLQFALDLAVLTSAFLAAYLLRFEFVLTADTWERLVAQLPLVLLVQLTAMLAFGVYSFIWRYVGLGELWAFVKASAFSGAVLAVLRLFVPAALHVWQVPLSIIVVDTVFAFSGIVALRVVRRVLYERYERDQTRKGSNGKTKPVLLVGAGRAGLMTAREIQGRGDLALDIRGFVDDDPEKQGAVVQGVKVLGTTRELARLVGDLGIDHVIVTIAKASRRQIRRIVEICDSVPVRAKIIPGLYEILDGKVEISRIRDIEIEDLLGRDPVQLEEDEIAAFLRGKAVMVTGAGGSIGSEIARQVARFAPSSLLLVERAEFVLFNIDRELRQVWPDQAIVPLVADVGDEARMRWVMGQYRPAVIFHAAAHKHVPMMETNPTEAAKNNVLGTRLTGRIAGDMGAEAFVLISTDKAVRPTSVMGASKRVAELVIQDLDRKYSTRFVAVRFGNVMGSAGSVIPIFREQIRRGGPVTVTHPEMVRYFMTIPEASQLVLQAGAMGNGGEIFILDMGEPVRILDMAKDMITLSGLKPFEDIDIVFSGIRPGEKLFEELETVGEHIAKTRHPKIFIGQIATYTPEEVDAAVMRLDELSRDGKERELRRYFNELLPEARLMI
ncbi:MAG: polysaccharide biosynthesis protein [Acidobacteria bacterium]|nr:polysaccharide biosynthesis protein [Acidobacteriota bacterium]